MTSARSYFFALVITAAAMASGNIAAHEGSRLGPPHGSGPAPASSPSIVCASTLQTLGGPNEIRAALTEGMVKFFRDSQIDSDRLREFLRDPLAAQINWNSGADLNSHAQAIALFQKFARALQPAEQSQLITDLTAALQAILAARETSQIIAQKSLERTAEIPLVTVFNARSGITSVAFSPDGRHVLTGFFDGIVGLCDSTTGKQLIAFGGDDRKVACTAMSPDGKFIFACSYGYNGRLFKTETGEKVRNFLRPTSWVSSVAFSPNGKHLLTGFSDSIVILWDLAADKEVRIFEGHRDRVRSVAFSSDGNFILSSSTDCKARLWEIETGRQVKIFQGHAQGVIASAFSSDGKFALTGSYDTTAKLWDLQSGNEQITFHGHRGWIDSVAFSPDGKHILTGSRDGTARLWPLPPQFWPRPQSTKAAAP